VIPIIVRFLEKINVTENGCWEWIGSNDRAGYGRIRINEKNVKIHRFIYEYYYGSICSDLTIDHLCRNTSCCNPLHLEQVTLQENILRGNGTAGINSRKTHCIHGHEFTKENIYKHQYPRRICKACAQGASRKRRLKNLV